MTRACKRSERARTAGTIRLLIRIVPADTITPPSDWGERKEGVTLPCYHPKLGIPTERGDGKTKMVIVPYKDTLALDYGIVWSDGTYHRYVNIPCGKCLGCRLDYAREWSTRCCAEAEYYGYDRCIFLTLTYDQEHLPLRPMIVGRRETAYDLRWMPQLVPAHLRGFFKRLRRYYEYHYNITDIRYYACGEYGSVSQRPHYHAIIFGARPAESWQSSTWCKRDSRGYYTWRADEISDKVWHYGNVIAGECSASSIEYVARYMLKKQKGDDLSALREAHIRPPFVRASSRPAIGYRYLDDHAEHLLGSGRVNLCTPDGGKERPLPRAFARRLAASYPDAAAALADRRATSSILSDRAIEYLSQSAITDILARREAIRAAKAKILDKRDNL